MQRKKFKSFSDTDSFDIPDDSCKKDQENEGIMWWSPFYVLTIGLTLFYIVYVQSQVLPKIVTTEESKNDPLLFCGECSKNTLSRLTYLGPRIFGDVLNEIQAPEIIEDELQKIIKKASSAQSIYFERQKGNGSYFLDFNMPFFNVYTDAQNVIALIEGSEGNHSLVVNCHYDSVALSPGASDDGISCTTMLEILRVLSLAPTRLKHNIVFLFNGAEESPLQGSHLFLTHEWAKKCRIVINLEAAGVGGKNILFQSGPGYPWLLKYYADNAPHPHGTVLGEEVFQSGIIPSDTDIRIFRDFGGIPGMDFAFWQGGHIYHSSFDSMEHIPSGSYQHIGDNTLALLQALGNADELNHMDDNSKGQMIYYDYLGWFMVRYSDKTNIIINAAALLLGISSIIVFVGPSYQWESIKETIKGLIYRLVIMVASMIATILAAALVSLLFNNYAPYVMPWYLNPIIVFPMYWCPGLAAHVLTTNLLEKQLSHQNKQPMLMTMHMNMIVSQVPWILLLFMTTAMGLRSSSLFFAPVLFGAISNLIIHLTPLKTMVYASIGTHFIVLLPVILYNMYFAMTLYMSIMPILGRSGVINNEFIMAIASSVFTLFIFGFALPFMTLVKNPKRTVFALVAMCLLSMLWAGVSGPPYSASPNDPRPQRYLIMHTQREYNNEAQNISWSDNRFIIYNMDKNSPNTIPMDKSLINSVANDCDSELYCGIPMLTSRTMVFSNTSSWIQANSPYFFTDTEATLNNDSLNCNGESSKCQLSLVVRGPNRLSFMVIPRPDTALVDWSLSPPVKATGMWNGRPVHFVHMACGKYECEHRITLSFNMEGQRLGYGGPVTDVVLSGHYMHRSRNKITRDFQRFLDLFPVWADVTAWPSAHKMYTF